MKAQKTDIAVISTGLRTAIAAAEAKPGLELALLITGHLSRCTSETI